MATADQQFCLRWNNHQSTLISVFDTLLENGTLVDCTLAAEGQYLKAHKVVLSACSPYLETLLSQHYEKHPIVILKDVKFSELKSMMDYMYRGEVNISQDQLGTFLKAAESLQIKGLSDNGDDARDVGSTASKRQETARPSVTQTRTPIESKRPAPSGESDASRDGSISPSSLRKRRRTRRPSQGDEPDSHVDTNACDLPNAQSTPLPVSVPNTSIVPTSVQSLPKQIVKQEPTSISTIPETGLKKEIMDPPSEPLLEPKTEYLDYMNNENSIEVEDLTLDDDDELDSSMDASRPGPSHGDMSNQGYTWPMSGDQSGTDEIFMAAQEAVGAAAGQRDSQDKEIVSQEESFIPSKIKVRSDLFEGSKKLVTSNCKKSLTTCTPNLGQKSNKPKNALRKNQSTNQDCISTLNGKDKNPKLVALRPRKSKRLKAKTDGRFHLIKGSKNTESEGNEETNLQKPCSVPSKKSQMSNVEFSIEIGSEYLKSRINSKITKLICTTNSKNGYNEKNSNSISFLTSLKPDTKSNDDSSDKLKTNIEGKAHAPDTQVPEKGDAQVTVPSIVRENIFTKQQEICVTVNPVNKTGTKNDIESATATNVSSPKPVVVRSTNMKPHCESTSVTISSATNSSFPLLEPPTMTKKTESVSTSDTTPVIMQFGIIDLESPLSTTANSLRQIFKITDPDSSVISCQNISLESSKSTLNSSCSGVKTKYVNSKNCLGSSTNQGDFLTRVNRGRALNKKRTWLDNSPSRISKFSTLDLDCVLKSPGCVKKSASKSRGKLKAIVKPKQYDCDYCNQEFNSHEKLKSHVNNFHIGKLFF